ncbi:hypothetical protein AWN76_004035 [Rhodothermaceae bacterium RA]|nr:hypothetical protein AWN76_004035 [Rhodothermaceae bacterium RA]
MSIDTVRWGLIGAGDVAEHKGGPALYTASHSRLVAVMSRREERARSFAERHGADRYYTDLDALLADEEVDAVYIATPPHVHCELTERVAAAGKHVLCEKPMAMTVAECRRMIEACDAAGVQLMIAYYRRFFPAYVRIKELLKAGAIGTPLQVRAHVASLYQPRPDGERSWLVQPGVAGGGFLTDVATHRLDLMTYYMGNPRQVAAFTDTLRFDFDVDDTDVLILRFEGGGQGAAMFSWSVGAEINEFELCGTDGRILGRDIGQGRFDVVAGGTTRSFHLPPPAITHLHLVEHFVACLRSGTPNRLSGEEGMQATRITEAAYQSSAEGTIVTL